jgi:hypothetical protein
MKGKKPSRPAGQLRRSQLITTFGPGAMLDLIRHAVIVGGLDYWGDPAQDSFQAVSEERLLAKVRNVLGREDVRMYSPPIDVDEQGEARKGIGVFLFPEWFVVQHEERRGDVVRSRRLCPRRELIKGKWVGPDKKKYRVVPVRFVQACVNGHISDIDWHSFVHEFQGDCRQKLWLDERGTSGDLSEIFVRCECGKATRSLAAALSREGASPPLGFCRGQRPWLGARAAEPCGGDTGKPQPNRLLVRSASDAYFAQTLSVISIPELGAEIRSAVDRVWDDFLMYVEDIGDLRKERKKAKVAAALEGHSDEAVWAEIERRKKKGTSEKGPDKSIKGAEIETLLAQGEAIGDDVPDGDFYARALPLPKDRTGPMRKVARVVLVDRLREVIAQVGFTRFEAAMADFEGELDLDVRAAPLARETTWVPAIENRGEGVLIAFSQDELDEWLKKPRVKARVGALRAGFDAWKNAHPKASLEFPGPRYILLHSLSHLLIGAVSLSCGYAASSIRERIYATDAGCGILLYTGTPDAEGTLGGLVQVGRRIEEHLATAIELGMLCSNDPVCAQHRPDSEQEGRFLHGAACHGCLLIAEPSCERRNEFLDRALVVPTVEPLECAFFEDEG